MKSPFRKHYMRSSAKTNFDSTFTFAVYEDGDRWVAHNLELDIVGVDSDKGKAIAEVRELTFSHIRFCIERKATDFLFRPAPDRFWKMVAEKKTARVKASLIEQKLDLDDLEKILSKTPVFEIDSSSHLAEKRQTA